MGDLSTASAIDCFMEGFAACRSLIRPCAKRQLDDGVWVVADTIRTKQPARTVEVITYHAADSALSTAVERNRIAKHFVCAFIDSADEVTAAVARTKALGYRFMGREPLFVVRTAAAVSHKSVDIRRVTTQEAANAIARVARKRQIHSQHITNEDAQFRLYAAYIDGNAVGWVRSVRTDERLAYVSGLWVQAEYRRRGIGRSLMSAMLEDDHRYGVEWSVLLASSAGALLYPVVGYEQRGILLLFGTRNKQPESTD